jgi:ATP-dependent Clp protease ATP-binding subunit ClpC
LAVTLELEPPVVVRAHASGAVYAYPLGDPELVCRAGDLDEALATQRMFLAEHLAKVPADQLAGFSFPDTAVLHEVPVLLPREDLDRRFGVDRPIAIPCVAVPDDEAWWVHVLPLRHVLHVAPGDDLRRRVVDEITRQVAAREFGPAQWAALLPALGHSLHRVAVSVRRSDHDDVGTRAQSRRLHEGERSRTAARELLERIGTDALRANATRRGPATIGRQDEITRLGALLGGDERVGVALVGPGLAGKTAVLEALLSQAVVPFRSNPVFATSGAALVAGQSGFGELAERIHAVMQAAATLDAILYFDNLADLFAGTSGGMEDLASALRPWIVEGRVRLVGECTAEAFEQFEKQQPALLACMHRVTVEPLGAEASVRIVAERAAWARRSEPDRPSLHAAAVAPLVELCERYLVDAAFPGKAVRLFEELRAIHRHDVDAAGKPHVIDVHDVYRAFSLRTGMPMFLLREDEQLRRGALEDEFRRRVIGQHEAISRVTETLCTVKARLQPPGKPLANFLFVGPTGVGKTEVAKTLARILFGGPERMVRFDMSEYTDAWAAERLIRGTQSDDGELTRRIRQQPFSVLLLDEIEKAHPAVFDLLLQVLGEGRLTDARGRTTHFGNTIIIMTSNLGASHRPTGGGSGFGGAQVQAGGDERRYYTEQVDRHFRPEFVNRIDRIIPFASLDRAEIAEVARVSLQRIRERAAFAQRGISLEVTDAALAELATRGYSPVYGARALRRELEDHLVAPVAGMLSEAGAVAEGTSVVVALGDDGLAAALGGRRPDIDASFGALRIAIVTPPGDRSVIAGAARFSRLRRNAATALDSPAIHELRQRAAYLTAELAAQPQGASTQYARNHGVATLREHQRITDALARLDAAMVAVEAVEELAAGDTSGALAQELDADADAAHAAFEIAVVHAIFTAEPRDAITIGLHAHTATTPIVRWLAWLDAWATELRWSVSIHRAGDRGPDWPALPWGPPRRLDRVREDFATTGDSAPWRDLLVSVTGPHCGWLLGLEAGLHRFWPADRATALHLTIRPITARTGLGHVELGDSKLAPPPRNAPEPLHRMTATREVFADGTVTMPVVRLNPAVPVDLAATSTIERLWFGELVRRSRDGAGLLDDLPQ